MPHSAGHNPSIAGRGPAGGPVGRAFSLVELIAVIAILGIMAASITPALGLMGKGTARAAAHRLADEIRLARTRAVASGTYCGVEIDLAAQNAALVIDGGNGSVEPMPGLTGAPRPPLSVPGTFPGVQITAFVNGRPEPGLTALWFDGSGNPYATAKDTLPAPDDAFTRDAVLTLKNGSVKETVTIRRLTGAID